MGTYWKNWAYAASIRGVKTAAQVGLILMGSDVCNIAAFDWPYILGCMASGFVVSILTSLVTKLPEVDGDE